jgi:excisionase family DNA binding protein
MDARGRTVTHLRAAPPARLTVDEVAAELHCGRRTVFRLLRAGAFPSIKVGRQRTIARADVDAYLATLAS